MLQRRINVYHDHRADNVEHVLTTSHLAKPLCLNCEAAKYVADVQACTIVVDCGRKRDKCKDMTRVGRRGRDVMFGKNK